MFLTMCVYTVLSFLLRQVHVTEFFSVLVCKNLFHSYW